MKKFAISATMAFAMAAIASASVTFDAATGKGFVGKGDVQKVLWWNNAQLQQSASSAVFTYVKTDTYEVVNAWATGNVNNPVSLNSHTVSVTTMAVVNGVVDADPRKVNGQKQFTGFNLMGFLSSTTVGTVPTVSPTVTYIQFSWQTTEWDGTYETVDNPNYNGHNSPTIQVKHYVPVNHTGDQLPAYRDENGNLVLYTEGDNKAVLSVSLIDSTGGLFVNGVALPITPAL